MVYATAELVRESVENKRLCRSFVKLLEQLDAIPFSSATSLRDRLARLSVSDAAHLRQNFERHSVAEKATSQTLSAVAGTLKPTTLKDEMLDHAKDEMRHSRMFAALAESISRGSVDDPSANYDFDWILEHDRKFVERYNGDVIDFVCDLFAGEVRTFSFVASYIEALSENDSALASKANRALRAILEDERRHIRYTALHIDDWIERGLDLELPLKRSFRNFDRNSWIEIAETARMYYERPTDLERIGGDDSSLDSTEIRAVNRVLGDGSNQHAS